MLLLLMFVTSLLLLLVLVLWTMVLRERLVMLKLLLYWWLQGFRCNFCSSHCWCCTCWWSCCSSSSLRVSCCYWVWCCCCLCCWCSWFTCCCCISSCCVSSCCYCVKSSRWDWCLCWFCYSDSSCSSRGVNRACSFDEPVVISINTISLSCHEQVCLMRLRFERYFSHHHGRSISGNVDKVCCIMNTEQKSENILTYISIKVSIVFCFVD